MTPHPSVREVGLRDLRDHLSEHLRAVKAGQTLVVTSRGRHVARVSPVDAPDALAELRARGLVTEPSRPRTPSAAIDKVKARGSVSDLVAEQRR